MTEVFPSISTISIKDATAGSIIQIPRHNETMLALVTDDERNNVRSRVWLNARMQDGSPSVFFLENWRSEETALFFGGIVRFEVGTAEIEVDTRGNFWESAGAIISISDQWYIRAVYPVGFYDQHVLVNIQNGSILRERYPPTSWTFLAWRLRLMDELSNDHRTLMEFSIKKPIRQS